MAISDDKRVLYSTVTKEVKERLQKEADKNHRSLSQEVAHILDLHLEELDKKGG